MTVVVHAEQHGAAGGTGVVDAGVGAAAVDESVLGGVLVFVPAADVTGLVDADRLGGESSGIVDLGEGSLCEC